jgi:D-sedoheptulose 7-phosphate isomerase
LHVDRYLSEVQVIAGELDAEKIEEMVAELKTLRAKSGRIFFLGLGGSAANCSHAAADLRTLCEVDAYSLCDNFAAFSAQANDHGFEHTFTRLLKAYKFSSKDAILILSVGGGTDDVSVSISGAVRYAKSKGAKVFGIVGPNGGITARMGDVVVKVPAPKEHITPHSEAFQAVLWHCIVSHPKLQRTPTKW